MSAADAAAPAKKETPWDGGIVLDEEDLDWELFILMRQEDI